MAKTAEERKAYMREYQAKKKAEKGTPQQLRVPVAGFSGPVPVATLAPPSALTNVIPMADDQLIPSAQNIIPPLRTKDQLEKIATAELKSIPEDRRVPCPGGDYNIVVGIRRYNEGPFASLWEMSTLFVKDGKVAHKKVMMEGVRKQELVGVVYKLVSYCQ